MTHPFITFLAVCSAIFVPSDSTMESNMARKRRKTKKQRKEEARKYKHVRSGAMEVDVGNPPETRWKSKRARKRAERKARKQAFLDKHNAKKIPKIKYASRFITSGLLNDGS